MATIPSAPPSQHPVDTDLPDFFTEPAASASSNPLAASRAADSGPPQAPPSGYAPSRVPNPIRDAPLLSLSDTFGDTLAPALRYRLHVQATSNNTIATLTDERANPVATFSGGSCGFKGVNRSGYEAGYQCAVRAFARLEQVVESTKTPVEVEVVLNGFGRGRDAFITALSMTEGESVRKLVARMTDKTPIKIGGTRAKKTRRL